MALQFIFISCLPTEPTGAGDGAEEDAPDAEWEDKEGENEDSEEDEDEDEGDEEEEEEVPEAYQPTVSAEALQEPISESGKLLADTLADDSASGRFFCQLI